MLLEFFLVKILIMKKLWPLCSVETGRKPLKMQPRKMRYLSCFKAECSFSKALFLNQLHTTSLCIFRLGLSVAIIFMRISFCHKDQDVFSFSLSVTSPPIHCPFCFHLLFFVLHNRAIYTRKNKTRTFRINGTFRLK